MTADYYSFIILILSLCCLKMWYCKSKMAARRGDTPRHSGTNVKSNATCHKKPQKSPSSGSENVFQFKISALLPQTQLENVPVSIFKNILADSCSYMLKCCLNTYKYPNVSSIISRGFMLSNVETVSHSRLWLGSFLSTKTLC